MPWLSKVAGVLEAWYPGQRSGAAIAATLFGRSDPSVHLPVTFPRNGSQGPTANRPERYPGVDNVAHYSEGIFVGYRYYDRFEQRPLFPFGFGLSYTTFSLRHLSVKRRGGGYRASLTLRNTGHMDGAEVVQAYLGFPAAAGEPPRQLEAFAKVFLAAGGARRVALSLPRLSFEYWNSGRHSWSVARGGYRLYVGASSRELPLSATIRIR
jgi:beta-glucosidase